MSSWYFRAVISGILGLSLMASACGSSGGGSPSSSTPKETLTVAGFNFSESSTLSYIYGGALAAKGYTLNYKLNLGNREVVSAALQKGDVDMYPGYAATELEFYNKGKGEATSDPAADVQKLNTYLAPMNLVALTASPAQDGNVFAMTKAGATKYSATKLSDLTPIGDKLTLGGPPECPTRPFCQAGLKSKYSINFKAFKSLDAGGPLTKAALDNGSIDVGLLFSSDAAIAVKGYTVLQDDKGLEAADNVVPVGSTKKFNSDATSILNSVSAKLTTAALIDMNKQTDIDKADPQTVAQAWLKSNGFTH